MAVRSFKYRNPGFVKLLLLSVVVLFSTKNFAQDSIVAGKDSLKSSVQIGMFFANPVGAYGSTDFTNAAAGYSKTGVGIHAGYSYRIAKGFCIKADLSYSKNLINNLKLASQIKNLTETQTGFDSINSSAQEANWKNYFLLGGISYQFWFGEGKKLGLEPELYAGADYCVTPDVVYNVRIDNLTFQTRNVSKGNFVFAHRESLKVNYLMGDRTVLSFNLGYSNASGNASGMERITTGNGSYKRTVNDYKINVAFIQIGFGLCTRF